MKLWWLVLPLWVMPKSLLECYGDWLRLFTRPLPNPLLSMNHVHIQIYKHIGIPLWSAVVKMYSQDAAFCYFDGPIDWIHAGSCCQQRCFKTKSQTAHLFITHHRIFYGFLQTDLFKPLHYWEPLSSVSGVLAQLRYPGQEGKTLRRSDRNVWGRRNPIQHMSL